MRSYLLQYYQNIGGAGYSDIHIDDNILAFT